MTRLTQDLNELKQEIMSGSVPDIRNITRLSNTIENHLNAYGEVPPSAAYELHQIKEAIEVNNQLSSNQKADIEGALKLERFSEENVPDITETELSIDGIEPEDNVVFLFGAGASNASGIPLVNELLDKLVQQAKRTQNEEFNDLMQVCKKHNNIGIEDLLTAVYLAEFAVSESSTLNLLKHLLFTDGSVPTFSKNAGDKIELEADSPFDDQVETDPTSVNFIQDAIQTLFGSIASEMIPNSENETHTELRNFIQRHDNTSIITTNYDYCIEQELFGEVSVNTTLNSIKSGSESEQVDLYKMHGSITWTYCDTCQSVNCVKPEKVDKKFDAEKDEETLPFPVKGICHVCSGERRPLLVPPTSFKFVQFPPLIDIRAAAKEELQNADYIIPVGYSFSDEDAYIYKLVWGAMRGNDDARMIIVDPNARELATELEERFEVQSSDFDTDRVVAYPGKSEEVMGDLVDQLLPSAIPAKDGEIKGAAVEESTE